MPRLLRQLVILATLTGPAASARPNLPFPVADTTVSSVARSLPTYRPGLALTLRAGTAGVGADITKSINRRLAVRLGANLFTFKGSLEQGKPTDQVQLAMDYSIRLNSFNLLLDYYPFQRVGFRLTGGAFYNLNRLTFFGQPAKDVKFNDVVFSVEEVGTLSGQANFQRLAPYVGFGWGHPFLRSRLRLAADIGFFYQQSPQITLTTTGMLTPSADQGPVIQRNLSPLKYYPIVNLGISFNFSPLK